MIVALRFQTLALRKRCRCAVFVPSRGERVYGGTTSRPAGMGAIRRGGRGSEAPSSLTAKNTASKLGDDVKPAAVNCRSAFEVGGWQGDGRPPATGKLPPPAEPSA